jgi:hypothetical protein
MSNTTNVNSNPILDIDDAVNISKLTKKQLFDLALFNNSLNATPALKFYIFVSSATKNAAHKSHYYPNPNYAAAYLDDLPCDLNDQDFLDELNPRLSDVGVSKSIFYNSAEVDNEYAESKSSEENYKEDYEEPFFDEFIDDLLNIEMYANNSLTPSNMMILEESTLIRLARGEKNVTVNFGFIETKDKEFIKLDFSGLVEPHIINEQDIRIFKDDLETISQIDEKVEEEVSGNLRSSYLLIIEALFHIINNERRIYAESAGIKIHEEWDRIKIARKVEYVLKANGKNRPQFRSIKHHLLAAQTF